MIKRDVSSKYQIMIFILFLLIILIITSISPKDNSKSNEQSSINEIQSEELPCRPVIPERIKLKCSTPQGYAGMICRYIMVSENNLTPAIDYRWADGTHFSDAGNLILFKGSDIGENSNYIYMKSNSITYKKEQFSSDGTILKPTTWAIRIAIDPNDKTSEGYKVVQYACSGTDIDIRNPLRGKYLAM